MPPHTSLMIVIGFRDDGADVDIWSSDDAAYYHCQLMLLACKVTSM